MTLYTKELGKVKVIKVENGEVKTVEKEDGSFVNVDDLPSKTLTILTFIQYVLQAIINFIKAEK